MYVRCIIAYSLMTKGLGVFLCGARVCAFLKSHKNTVRIIWHYVELFILDPLPHKITLTLFFS